MASRRYTPKTANTEGAEEITMPEVFGTDLGSIEGGGTALREHYAALTSDERYVELAERVSTGQATLIEREEFDPMVEVINQTAQAVADAETAPPVVDGLPDPAPAPDPAPVIDGDPAPAPDPAPVIDGDPAPAPTDGDPAPVVDGDPAPVIEGEPTGRELITAAMALVAATQQQSTPPAALVLANVSPAVPREVAPLVASANVIKAEEGSGGTDIVTLTSAPMTDAEWGTRVANLSRAQGDVKEVVDLGGWRVWQASAEQIAPAGANGSQIANLVGRSIASGDKLSEEARTAAACPPGCIRRDIADCGNYADPLNMFSEYPCDLGSVTYFRGYSMSEFEGGLTVWDEEKQAQFNAAYDQYNEALASGDIDAIATAMATVKACEKRCALIKCRKGEEAVMLPIMICLKLTNEVSYSQPESIAAARGAMTRLLLRERNRQRRTLIQGFAHHYKVDGADYGGLGAGCVVYDAIQRMMAIGSVKERVDHGGYIVGIDYGLLAMLRSDNFLGCHAREGLSDAFGGLPIRVLYDSAYTAAGIPGIEPFAADLNEPGPGNAVDLPGWPTGEFCIELFNPNDFDFFSVPDITMRGTRSMDDVLRNMVTALILETHEGIMKPGCNPNYTMKFNNLKVTGAKVGCLEPGPDWCVPSTDPLIADDDDDPDGPGGNAAKESEEQAAIEAAAAEEAARAAANTAAGGNSTIPAG
jgi:hypothetical protein